MKKYCVMLLDLIESDCSIISVHENHKNALESLNNSIDSNIEYKDIIYYKRYHDNCNSISIYKNNYFTKTLIAKYLIKEYNDGYIINTQTNE